MHPLLSAADLAFAQAADPRKAEPMARYMKNLFPFYGLQSAKRRELAKGILQKHALPTLEELPHFVKEGYGFRHREMHYFTSEVAMRHIKKVPKSFIATVAFQVTTHSWWDTVDMVATNQASNIVRRFPELSQLMDDWIVHENLWIRRTAILHQLKYKKATDEDRLFGYCLQCAESKEFFIQKAIGWALREYSKTQPEAVIRFVANNPLSPLSKREGLKWLKKKKGGAINHAG